MTTEALKTTLKSLIEDVKNESIVAEFRDEVTDAQIMGLILSRYFDWSGSEIVRTALFGLEDSNFHTFNAKFQALAKKEKILAEGEVLV